MTNPVNGALFRPPRKVTIVESIVDQIVEQIQQGKLNAGDRLPSERQLIEVLGVSRSSVREALQGLSVMGLVESRPGQGSFVATIGGRLAPNVASPTLADHLQRQMRLQLVEARRTIEPPISRLAAQRVTPGSATDLRQSFEAYRRHLRSWPGETRGPDPHNDLHLKLAELSGNPFFVAVVQHLLSAVPHTLRSREEIVLDSTDMQRILADEIVMHEAIVTAVERGDGEAAYRAMDDHLNYERRLVERLFPEEVAA